MDAKISHGRFDKLKVLLVDDSRTIRRSAQALLEQCGCEPTLAVDGFDALCKVEAAKPAIIFMDVMMPRLDGFQTCALLKDSGRFRSIPIVLLSAREGAVEKVRAELAGAALYLTKPFSRNDLLGAIGSLCGPKKTRKPGGKESVNGPANEITGD